MTQRDEFTTGEREVLEAWTVPPPPRDLAARVLARARTRPRRRTPVWLALAAGLLLAGGLAWLLAPARALQGQLVAQGRTTQTIGSRAVVVAEDGASLRWRRAGGALGVEQQLGNVFYRVQPGSEPFEVRTAVGSVRVLGTCFRLEVMEMKASRAGLTGATVGAAAATLLLVTVYEGKVLTASPRGTLEVVAGESARLRPGHAPEAVGESRGSLAHAGGASPGQSGSGQDYAPTTVEGLLRQNQQLQAQKQQLESTLEVLQNQLKDASSHSSRHKILGLDQKELEAMARRCELRWDLPPVGTSPPQVDGKTARALGLSSAERSTINKVFNDFNSKLMQDLRRLYVEVTGDAKTAEGLSPWAMMSEIEDKSPRAEIKRVFQQVSRERAGLATPGDAAAAPTVERLYRLLTTAGDRVEQALGAEVGPDLARRYREQRGGFGQYPPCSR